MKLSVKNLTIVAVIGLIFPVVALAVPAIPHQFYGTVNFTNGPAPDGLLVEVKVTNGVSILSTKSTVTKNGKYGYDPLFKVEDNNNNLSGKTVEFYVDGVKANETAIFVNGNSSQINLTISASLPTTPTPTPASAGASAGGGGGSSPTPPASTQLSAEAKKVDFNNDDKIDILDFNALMVNWGSASLFDFNLLMINWTL